MTTKLRVSLIAVLIPAMAALGFVIPPAQPSGCVAIVVKAFTSPAKPVKGSFACLTDEMQVVAITAGYSGDAGLQQLATERGRDHARYIGPTSDGGYVYELSGPKVDPVTLLLYADGVSGRVYRIDQDNANQRP